MAEEQTSTKYYSKGLTRVLGEMGIRSRRMEESRIRKQEETVNINPIRKKRKKTEGSMAARESGDQYYYSKGFTRILAKMDDRSRRMLKTVAIMEDKPIMKVVSEALEDFASNPSRYPRDFEGSSNGSLKTFVPKALHKKVKILAAKDFGRRLGDLSGFILASWAKEKMNEEESAQEEVGSESPVRTEGKESVTETF